jgi:hypothetical protein
MVSKEDKDLFVNYKVKGLRDKASSAGKNSNREGRDMG